MGTHTADAESITSIITRLADRNRIRKSEMFEFIDDVAGGIFPRLSCKSLAPNAFFTINTHSTHTAKVTAVLSQLCNVSPERMKLHTLSRFDHLFAQGYGRRFTSFGPNAFRQRVPYEKVIWNVSGVHFDTDGSPLLSRCPHCRKEIKKFSWRTGIGQCAHCSKSLDDFLPDDMQSKDLTTWDSLEYAQWASETVADLISIGPEAQNFDFHKSFAEVYRYAGFKNKSQASQKLGINHATLNKWERYTKKPKPKIENFLSILYVLDLKPIEFFTARKLQVQGGAELCPMLRAVPLRPKEKQEKPRGSINHKLVRETVLADIKFERHIRKPRGMYLMDRFGHPEGSLLRIVDDIIPEFTKKGRFYDNIDQQVKRAGLIAELEEAYRIFKKQGIKFNYTNLRKVFYPHSRIRPPWVQDIIDDMKSGRHKVDLSPHNGVN